MKKKKKIQIKLIKMHWNNIKCNKKERNRIN